VESALSTVKQSDKDRAELFRRAYRIDWLDASIYDLTLNSDSVPAEAAITAIVESVKAGA
jgi:cytidylate kinase